MQLWFNVGSPFARKVRILVREKGMEGLVSEVPAVISPVEVNQALARLNPLVKIPALVLDDDEVLYDSRVICEYLDGLHAGSKVLPASGARRFDVLRIQALADGLLDAAVLCRYEIAVRPQALHWDAWMSGQRHKISAALQALECQVESWHDEFDLGKITVACALGYLDFRFDDWAWRDMHPQLNAWFANVSQRASVAATKPI